MAACPSAANLTNIRICCRTSIAEADELQRKEDAIGVARIDSDIAAITEVMNYKASNWCKLRDWGIQSNELTPKEDQLLMLAGSAGRIPSLHDKRLRFFRFVNAWGNGFQIGL